MSPISVQVDFSTKRQLVRFDPTAGSLAYSLPKASAFKGWTMVMKNASSTINGVTVKPTAGDTLDGQSQTTLPAARSSKIFVSDGVSDWMLVSEYVGL